MSVDTMIAAAEKSIGLGESPDNTNYITEWYGLNGQPWCDQAITYWAFHSNNQQAVTGGGKFAYTVAHAQWFADHGRWHSDVAGIQRGDIVFFDWAGSNRIAAIDHVGIVTGTNGRDVYTIEGNSNNVCARRVRTAVDIAGYGRPAYGGAPAPRPAPSYVAYPGLAWFQAQPHDPIVTAMGKRLVAEGCGRYESGPGPQWTEADRASYAAWQRKLGYTGSEADGWPGKSSWDRLKVPR